MKKSIIVTLSLCISLSIVASEPDFGKSFQPAAAHPAPTTRSGQQTLPEENQLSNLHDLCNQVYTLLQTELLQGLNSIDQHINHWKQERLHPVQSTVTQSPRFWTSSMAYGDIITRNIFRLKLKHQNLAENLGKLNEIMQDFKQVDTLDSIKKHIIKQQPILTGIIINNKPTESLQNSSYARLASYLIKALTIVKDYKKNLNFEIQEFKSPNHFERNWIKYLTSITALAASGYYVYQNQDALRESAINWATATKEGISNFWKNHIQKALTDARDELFKPTDLEIEKENIESGCRHLSTILKNDCPEYTQPMIDNALEQYQRTGAIPLKLVKKMNYMMENPFTSLFNFFEAPQNKRLWAFWVHTQKRDGELLVQRGNTITKIALVTPALFIARTTMNVAYKTLNLFKSKHVYTPVKKYLLKMERKLNAQTDKSERPSYGDQGLMIYWGYQLRKVINLIPTDNRLEFIKDIKEIERTNFNAQQKISTIKRMYRTYDFLNPSVH